MTYIDYQRITPEGYIRVVNSADYDSIVSYTPLSDITVFVDAVVNLPNTVEATFKSGKVEIMVIKWELVNIDTSTAGAQKIYGDIGNGAAAVLQNVIVNELSDVDILRQIRDANPTSQLPSLWLDSEDPYTQWWDDINGLGVLFGGDPRLDDWADEYGLIIPDISNRLHDRVYYLSIDDDNFYDSNNINKLTYIYFVLLNHSSIQNVDLSNLTYLQNIEIKNNINLSTLNISNCINLNYVNIQNNVISNLNFNNSYNIEQLYVENNKLSNINLLPLIKLIIFQASNNLIENIAFETLSGAGTFVIDNNKLISITTLVSRGNIATADFSNNKFDTNEINRLLSIGFTAQEIGTQNP